MILTTTSPSPRPEGETKPSSPRCPGGNSRPVLKPLCIPPERFSRASLATDLLTPCSPLPAADFTALSPRHAPLSVVQRQLFNSAPPTATTTASTSPRFTFDGYASEGDAAVDHTTAPSAGSRKTEPQSVAAPRPSRASPMDEQCMTSEEEHDDDDHDISGLSPTHTCVKLGARVLYLPRGRAAPGMLVDIIDYNPGKEKWLVQMPGGRTHWMVLSRDKFMVDRCWKIHSARLAEQHRLYKYALSVSDDMFVPCIAPGFRHWSFKPIKIPEATAAPVKASRGRPRTRGGLAATTGGRRSAAAASTQQRQSGRKRKTVTYDEEWVGGAADDVCDEEVALYTAAAAGNKRTRRGSPSLYTGGAKRKPRRGRGMGRRGGWSSRRPASPTRQLLEGQQQQLAGHEPGAMELTADEEVLIEDEDDDEDDAMDQQQQALVFQPIPNNSNDSVKAPSVQPAGPTTVQQPQQAVVVMAPPPAVAAVPSSAW